MIPARFDDLREDENSPFLEIPANTDSQKEMNLETPNLVILIPANFQKTKL